MALDFPDSPTIGDEFTGGGFTWVWTGSSWDKIMASVATGGNGFSLIVGTSGNTTYAFETPQPAGAYSFTSELGDTTFDIYLISPTNTNVGYASASDALEATGEFDRIVLYGATNNDIISFEFKPASSPLVSGDVDGGAAPFLTSATPVALPFFDATTTVTGGNFAANVEIVFTGQDGINRPAKNIVRSSSTSLIVTRPDTFPVEQEPYTMTATNPGIPDASVVVNELVDYFVVGSVDYLVVAGGGGGAVNLGGGGGAGGFRTVTRELISFSTPYTVTVGAGGAGGVTSGVSGVKGVNSTFGITTSTGGGFGGGSGLSGGPGGSGGGASAGQGGGVGNQGGFTPVEGFNGGSSGGGSHGGGGGGAGAAGANSGLDGNAVGINGGIGKVSSITGIATYYAGGAGSGGRSDPGSFRAGGLGGLGGGGNGGSTTNNPPAQSGVANTGGGGGGAGTSGSTVRTPAGNGGSGVVILRYPAAFTITVGAGLTGSTTVDGTFKVTTITAGTGNVSWAA